MTVFKILVWHILTGPVVLVKNSWSGHVGNFLTKNGPD